MPTNVLLCDGPDEVARLQYHLLREAPDLLVEVTTDALQAVDAAARSRPDVIVVDVDLAGVPAPELIRRFRAASPTSRVLVRSRRAEGPQVAEALAAGAGAYLLSFETSSAVLSAMRAVLDGGMALSPGAADGLGEHLAATVLRVRELEDDLERVRSEVAQGTSAKGDFLANVSHELRTPVTIAKGIAYVLRNPNVPDVEREEFLDQLQASLDKLMGLVDEVISLAELERGTFSLELSHVDLGPLIRNAVDEATRRYPSVPIAAAIPDALIAVADGGRIGGVVSELLDNACRYSPVGNTVVIAARSLDEGVVVTVTDHGEGLDRHVAAQSFRQPFSTGEGTLRKEKAGVGVGLHLSRQIVIQHGGVLWTDPLPGGGTRVSFCIPSREGERLQAPPAGAA
ncbi:MAG: ATP-binding protein [Actinomycetota bacterium]